MAGELLRCQRCSHPWHNHRPKCLWTMQGGWNEELKAFLHITRCDCEAYIGIDPKDLKICAHEFLMTAPKTCVHCLKEVSTRKW